MESLSKSLVTVLGLFIFVPHLRTQVAFAPAANYVVGNSPTCIVAADINGDGKVDLISVNQIGNSLSVLTNNGNGVFGFYTTIAIGGNPVSATAMDVNGDGNIDLISARPDPYLSPALSIFTNNGSGNFALSSKPAVGYWPQAVITADVNNDGKPDLISGDDYNSTFDNALTVLTNNASGGFVMAASVPINGGPNSILATDVNEDGYLDLVTAGGGYVTVLTNNHSASFNPTFWPGSPGAPQAIVAADVNGDNHVDLITADGIGNTLTIFTNNGHGRFAAAYTLNTISSSTPFTSLVAADFNGDGKVDLAWADTSGDLNQQSILVFTNNNNAGFASALSLLVGGSPRKIIATDVNGDGKLDLVAANNTSSRLVVFINVPALAINSSSNSLLVSWSSSWTNWTLQQNSDIATTNWSSSDGVSDNGTNKSLMITSQTDNLFFRLSHP